MVKSKYCILNQKGGGEECNYDVGGYFIINGNEKVIISQEKIANNLIHVYKNPKNYSKYSHICETRSLNENTFAIPKVSSIKITNKSEAHGYISITGRTIPIDQLSNVIIWKSVKWKSIIKLQN